MVCFSRFLFLELNSLSHVSLAPAGQMLGVGLWEEVLAVLERARGTAGPVFILEISSEAGLWSAMWCEAMHERKRWT